MTSWNGFLGVPSSNKHYMFRHARILKVQCQRAAGKGGGQQQASGTGNVLKPASCYVKPWHEGSDRLVAHAHVRMSPAPETPLPRARRCRRKHHAAADHTSVRSQHAAAHGRACAAGVGGWCMCGGSEGREGGWCTCGGSEGREGGWCTCGGSEDREGVRVSGCVGGAREDA
eukprot:352288-Chlamydomonas_euryale.AAC.5